MNREIFRVSSWLWFSCVNSHLNFLSNKLSVAVKKFCSPKGDQACGILTRSVS